MSGTPSPPVSAPTAAAPANRGVSAWIQPGPVGLVGTIIASPVSNYQFEVLQGASSGAYGNQPYVGGRLSASQKVEAKTGYFECDVACPAFPGVSFAFWLETSDQFPPEIDIVRISSGRNPDNSIWQTATSNLWNASITNPQILNTFSNSSLPSWDATLRHKYGVLIDLARVTVYWDHQQVAQWPLPAGYTHNLWPTLEYTQGGTATGAISAALPTSVRVGYVECWATLPFTPVTTPSVTDIQLSRLTVNAGVPTGTVVGNITVVMSDSSTFSGTLALGGAAASTFRISGGQLLTNATIAGNTNYPISIIATNLAGSLARNFTVQGVAVVTTNATVDFSAATGKTMAKTLWGFTTSIYNGNVFANATFRNTANANLKPAAIWINPDWTLDEDFANGNMTNINGILNNYRGFCQPGIRIFMGVAFKTSSGTASQVASRAANFATWLSQNGFSDIMDFSVGGLWFDVHGDGISEATGISYFSAVADALHAVNPAYRVWGPAQWNPGFAANTQWGNAANMSTRCNGVLWMSYDVLPDSGNIGQPMTDSKATAYGPKGYNNPDAPNQRAALAGTPLANVQMGALDLNMSEYATEAGQYIGGIYMALYILGAFKQTTNVTVFTMQAIGGANWPGNAIGNPFSLGGDMTRVTASGYILGKAGQSVFGPEYTSSTTFTNMAIVAVKPTASTFAIMLVNYDTVNSRTLAFTINGATPTGTIARWEIGKAGGTTPVPTIGTQANLSSVAVGSEMCVILTGSLA